ncbi:MAG: hypothetical protein K2W95_28685 [Candidatus Obscuribacterales bacterium]|nr:hypothetical protein [Candidatus Obscuribacterales bacterium]
MRKNISRQSKTEVQGQLWRELQQHRDEEACDYWDMMYREWQSEPDPPDMMDGLKLCFGEFDCHHLVLDEGIAVMLHRVDDVVVAANCLPEAEWYALPENPFRRLQEQLREQRDA